MAVTYLRIISLEILDIGYGKPVTVSHKIIPSEVASKVSICDLILLSEEYCP